MWPVPYSRREGDEQEPYLSISRLVIFLDDDGEKVLWFFVDFLTARHQSFTNYSDNQDSSNCQINTIPRYLSIIVKILLCIDKNCVIIRK